MRLIICIVSILGIYSLGLAQGAVDSGRGNSSKQSVKSSRKGKKGEEILQEQELHSKEGAQEAQIQSGKVGGSV